MLATENNLDQIFFKSTKVASLTNILDNLTFFTIGFSHLKFPFAPLIVSFGCVKEKCIFWNRNILFLEK